MKKLFILLTLLLFVIGGTACFAGNTYVKGYVKRDGTFVAPHFRSSANNTKLDNYSTQGNSNPFTGSKGYESAYPSNDISSGDDYYGGNNSNFQDNSPFKGTSGNLY